MWATLLTAPAPHTPPAGVLLTNWVDVIKVRQQLAGPGARNLLATGWTVVRAEGLGALGKGVTPAVARGVLYGGERLLGLSAAAAGVRGRPAPVGCCWGPGAAAGGRDARVPQPALALPRPDSVPAALAGARCPAHPYEGMRIGLYSPMKRLLGAEAGDPALARKVAAGMLSGALAAGAHAVQGWAAASAARPAGLRRQLLRWPAAAPSAVGHHALGAGSPSTPCPALCPAPSLQASATPQTL